MFDVTFQASEKAGSRGRVVSPYNLESMAKTTCKPLKGPKNGQGFIRGALTTDSDGNILKRCNENLEYSKLLIIDGDGGLDGGPTPSIECCHDALVSLGYNHVLYTTHSHSAEFHKYRGIVELTESIQEHELSANMNQLIKELRAHGCALKFAHEMKTWSQIWYLPRRADPDDGLFVQLTYFDGKEFDTIHVEKEESYESNDDEVDASTETLEKMFQNISTGDEYHESLKIISYQLIKDGNCKNRKIVYETLKSLLENSKQAGTQRCLDRIKELDRLIDGAIKRVQEEQTRNTLDYDSIIEDENSKVYTRPMPLPPGRTGRLMEALYKGMQRPSIEIAHVSVFGTLAAMCGAKFNTYTVGVIGLNLYYILTAPTGSGKSQIRSFIEHVFMNCLDGKIVSLSGTYNSFLNSGSVTTPKAIYRHINEAKSCIGIMNEAGLNLGEKSGSPESTMAYILELYTSSGYCNSTPTKSYSSGEDDIKAVKGTAASFIYESVETSLGKAVQNTKAVENGFIPRNDILTITKRPGVNKNNIENPYHFVDNDEDIVHQIDKILKAASSIQAIKTPYKPVFVRMTKMQREEYIEMDEYYRSNFEGQGFIDDISTRILIKIVKVSSIVTVFNEWDGEDELYISDEAWEYAKDFYKWYMDNLHILMAFYETVNPYDEALGIMRKAIIQAAKKTKADSNQTKIVIRKSEIMNILKKNNGSMLKRLSDASKIMHKGTEETVNAILVMMQNNGKIKIYESHGDCKVPCIVLLEGF